MEVTAIATTPDYVHIGLAGRMDSAGVDKQEIRVYALFAPTNRNPILDLSQVTFLASMGIRVLITAAKTAKTRGLRAVIVAPRGPIRDTLSTAGLGSVLSIVDDPGAAIEWLRTGGPSTG